MQSLSALILEQKKTKLVAAYSFSPSICHELMRSEGLPKWHSDKESACNVGDPGLTPVSGKSPGGGNDKLLQYFCLENSMDRGP